MKKISATIKLNYPIQTVFDFINDQQNLATLNRHNFQNYTVISAQSVGTGAQSRFILKTGVFREPVEIQVVTSQSPHLLVEEGRLKEGQFRINWQLSELSPTQTELEIQTEYHTTNGLASLLSDKINQAFARIYQRLLTDLSEKLGKTAPSRV